MISLEKLKILTLFQKFKNVWDVGKLIVAKGFVKLPKNVWDVGKLIVAKGFEKLPKVQ